MLAAHAVVVEGLEEAEGPPAGRLEVLRHFLANLHPDQCVTIDTMDLRSREVTGGFERAPARAMLRAVGMTDDDWDKPQVGVASSWNEVTPCNMPLDLSLIHI